jgi:hypothetical protein
MRALYQRLFLITLLVFLVSQIQSAQAQLLRPRRTLPPPDAIIGQPFGVGRVSLQAPEARPSFFGERDFVLHETNNRVFYAAFVSEPIRTVLRDLLNRPQNVTVFFLFIGEEPLDLSLSVAGGGRIRIQPRRDDVAHSRLVDNWWQEYTDSTRRAGGTSEYPRMVDEYLLTMLAGRMGLRLPQQSFSLFNLNQRELDISLGELTGAEPTRLRIQREVMLPSSNRPQAATEPLPKPIETSPPEDLDLPPDIAVEPLAAHVPEECFYVRFGTFNNYLWFRHVMEDFGGDLRNLVSMRGVDFRINEKVEQQLVLRETALAELLGPRVIADVALVGQDMFLREGPAIGMLFQANNNLALRTDIRSQRAAALERHKDAKETTIDIDGHSVSFLSTPDNRIRSFYAADGDFHFVTTSRTMARRFFEAGAGKRALGGSAEFRLARSKMPLSRDDTVFAYLSAAFFENLAGPQYRIESQRRLLATSEIDVVQIARLAARNEGFKSGGIDDLARAGFVPSGFGEHADGSRVELPPDGAAYNSLRGAEGFFTPVPDVAFDSVTPAEARSYEEFAQLIAGRWQRLDPVMVAVKRYAGEQPGLEHVVLDARVAPFAAQNYKTIMNYVGQPSSEHVAPLAGNLAWFEAVLRSQAPEPTHVYAGIRNIGVPWEIPLGEALGSLGVLFRIKYYFGGWPGAGPMQFFGIRDDLPVDPQGFGRARLGLWQRTLGPFVTGSPDFEVLADITSRLEIVRAERPAQLWVDVADVGASELSELINGIGYFRARQVTGGNVHFLQRMTTQLGVSPDRALVAAEDLLNARLICALGGEFKLEGPRGGQTAWTSTAWDESASRLITQVPRGFMAPPLDWFRGMQLDGSVTSEEVSAFAVVKMYRRPRAAKTGEAGAEAVPVPALPSFPSLKGLNFDWFKSGGKADDKPEDEAAKEDGKKQNQAPAEELPEPKE